MYRLGAEFLQKKVINTIYFLLSSRGIRTLNVRALRKKYLIFLIAIA